MKRQCAWCGTVLGPAEEDGGGDALRVTHTICPDCRRNIEFQRGVALHEYLDSLTPPIIVVDGNAQALFANRAACTAMGLTQEQLVGKLGGEVFECAYARLPEGCGNTVHCSGCAIRRAVEATARTGEPRYQVPARLSRYPGARSPIELLITTELAGEAVLLRVELTDSADRTPGDTDAPSLAEVAAARDAS